MTQHSKNHPVDLTGQPRRVAACLACGEVNEMAAFGQCFRCYRRMHREKERARCTARVDRHATARQKQQNQIMHALGTTMKGLTSLGVSDTDRLRIRAVLEPYLTPAKAILGGPPLMMPPMNGITADDIFGPPGETDPDLDDDDEREQ